MSALRGEGKGDALAGLGGGGARLRIKFLRFASFTGRRGGSTNRQRGTRKINFPRALLLLE
jgi:hypothetical protein